MNRGGISSWQAGTDGVSTSHDVSWHLLWGRSSRARERVGGAVRLVWHLGEGRPLG